MHICIFTYYAHYTLEYQIIGGFGIIGVGGGAGNLETFSKINNRPGGGGGVGGWGRGGGGGDGGKG